MPKLSFLSFVVFLSIIFFLGSGSQSVFAQAGFRTITDAFGRQVEVPESVNHVICSGAGCLRLLVYLRSHQKVVAVDTAETKKRFLDARPYALSNPQFKQYPVFGEFRGHDSPELILSLKTLPDVIFKAYSRVGDNPDELQNKTGIPVVAINYGNLGALRNDFYQALRIMGKVLAENQRAEEVITFFDFHIGDLNKRTVNIPDIRKKACYIGGVAYRGPHGFQSTEPAYPPFSMVNTVNVAFDPDKSPKELFHADVSKEKIVEWNPELIFVDLSTIQSDHKANAIYELKHGPVYQSLHAVRQGEVYGLLPYNWYTKNFGSVIANAYYIGKVKYPKQFKDIDSREKADEIYTFLVGKPVFQKMNRLFANLIFTKLKLD
ncbi:MAG: ABC transporter substrate-binding protein [Proteobacteria bacterium]|nr:ABC transporter substrate-binding protein [Pseudomonadota bacterium]